MTNEEKEKAYDEALERARKIHDEILNNERLGFPEQIREIFPELRESEDERIRRALVEYFGPKVQLDFVRGVPIQKIRDWLEKQKEQKVDIDKLRKDIYQSWYNDGYQHGKEDAQKEQPSPAEWSEEDERMLSRCEKSIESSKQFADSDTFKKAKDNEIDWLENRFKSLRPSWKPSEEQMDCLCAAVDAAIRKHNESVSGYKPAKVLKSLYEQLRKL